MSRHTLISNSFSSLTELAGNVLNSEHCSYLDNGTYVKKKCTWIRQELAIHYFTQLYNGDTQQYSWLCRFI